MHPTKKKMCETLEQFGELSIAALAKMTSMTYKNARCQANVLVEGGWLAVRVVKSSKRGPAARFLVRTTHPLDADALNEPSDREMDEKFVDFGEWWPRADPVVVGAMGAMVRVGRAAE